MLGTELTRQGHGRLVITAFTGVAAAAFLAPTVQRLMSMGAYGNKPKQHLSTDALTKARAQFKAESAIDIEDVGVLVIDEVSFMSTEKIGLAEKRWRQMLCCDRPWGGLAVALVGDNWQLPAPQEILWCVDMVKAVVARQRGGAAADVVAEAGSGGAVVSAFDRGLETLAGMRRVVLVKLMRAHEDPDFAALQVIPTVPFHSHCSHSSRHSPLVPLFSPLTTGPTVLATHHGSHCSLSR